MRRWRVRRAMARLYRAIGLPPPRCAFVASPVAAAVATGIATGVRWLQRHPETHAPLFGGLAVDAAIRDATDRAIAAMRLDGPDALRGTIVAAIEHVVAAPPRVLSGFARPATRSIEPVSAAPALAAAEGWIEDATFEGPLATAHDGVVAWLEDTQQAAFAALDPVVARGLTVADTATTPAELLVRCAALWWGRRGPFTRRRNVVANPPARVVRDTRRVVGAVGAIFVHADFWIAAERAHVATDEHRRLHRIGGPAATWRDGFALSFLHGVHVPDPVARGEFTVEDILAMPNAEVRRTMIELYERDGQGRFLRDARADLVAMDLDHLGHARRLLRVPMLGDEPYVGIEVVNSTPEPDGTHRHYFLRVPPWVTTCRQAVAWTFDIPPDEFEPSVET